MSTLATDRIATHWPNNTCEVSLDPVVRVIYTSKYEIQGSVLEEMRNIRDQSLLNNGPAGVRVMLLAMNGWFAQWIEGPAQGIDALLDRVAHDSRHQNIKMMHRSVGRARLFRPWICSIVQASGTTLQFVQRMYAHPEQQGNGEDSEPAVVWANLCTPPAKYMPRPLGHHLSAMMLSAKGTQTFEMIEWLAEDEKLELVRRRFAGGVDDAPDVESDYLDLPEHGSRGLRLVANARKGLAMGMPHAFLPGHSAVVLLFDGSAQRNQGIVERIMLACQQVHHSPTIIGLGTRSSVTPELQGLVERNGFLWLSAISAEGEQDSAGLWRVLEPELLKLD